MNIILWCILMCTTFINENYAGIMHSHKHEINKERESDGAYIKHAKEHFSNSEGEHNSAFDHEAIVGSYKEAEEYDNLSPEEAKKKLATLLEKMDKDNNKHIDKKELKTWILRSFRMLSEEEAQERFEEADWDNDGQITWNEYLSDTYGVDSEEDETLRLHEENFNVKDSSHRVLISEDKEMWKAADKNRDNKLNSAEFVLFSNPEDHPEMVPVMLEQTLRTKDKNGDKAINFEEFINENSGNIDQSQLLTEKTKFLEYDKDNDGKLTGFEIMAWIVPNNDDIADEEVEHLLESADDNKDDILSFDEILLHHDDFVGSEVTDFGEHLHNLHKFQDEL